MQFAWVLIVRIWGRCWAKGTFIFLKTALCWCRETDRGNQNSWVCQVSSNYCVAPQASRVGSPEISAMKWWDEDDSVLKACRFVSFRLLDTPAHSIIIDQDSINLFDRLRSHLLESRGFDPMQMLFQGGLGTIFAIYRTSKFFPFVHGMRMPELPFIFHTRKPILYIHILILQEWLPSCRYRKRSAMRQCRSANYRATLCCGGCWHVSL